MSKSRSAKSLVKAECLVSGDVIGIIAPASPPPDPKSVDRVVEQVEQLGFKPKLGQFVRERKGYLAGNDRNRAADLMGMFTDPRVKGMICLRGGYGTARLVDRLDYSVIRNKPKVFAGYSDITSLHCALLTKAGLVTFHSPMLNEGLGSSNYPKISNQTFLDSVTEAKPFGSICDRVSGKGKVTILRRGIASGRLIGGNLSVLVTTIGTSFQPSFRGRILFIEDIGEVPYRLDRMLTHLLNAGLLQQVAGVAVGVNINCEDPLASRRREYRQSSLDVLQERLEPLGVPVVLGLPFGHQPINATIPIGTKARLDANRGDLIITESAVR